jgi:hypothetical protein
MLKHQDKTVRMLGSCHHSYRTPSAEMGLAIWTFTILTNSSHTNDGRKHYIMVTNDNNMVAWGNVFKERPSDQSLYSEGFAYYYGDSLFDEG